MQFLSFCLFMLICSYSLVISAPINHTVADSHETKQQKATAIAHRLLKELAGEHVDSPMIVQSSTNGEENKDAIAPASHPVTEKVEAHVDTPTAEDSYDEDNQDLELTPTIDDLYEIYNDKYNHILDEDESSSEALDQDEVEDDELFPVGRQELLRYLAEQEDASEELVPTPHAPVMDDSIMTAEDHQQRRRRSAY